MGILGTHLLVTGIRGGNFLWNGALNLDLILCVVSVRSELQDTQLVPQKLEDWLEWGGNPPHTFGVRSVVSTWGAWVAQSVKRLTSAQVMISQLMSWTPHPALC